MSGKSHILLQAKTPLYTATHDLKLLLLLLFFSIHEDNDPRNDQAAAERVDRVSDETLVAESGKMQFLVELLDQLKSDGHRCLVFSQSRKVLDIVQKVVTNRVRKWIYMYFCYDVTCVMLGTSCGAFGRNGASLARTRRDYRSFLEEYFLQCLPADHTSWRSWSHHHRG